MHNLCESGALVYLAVLRVRESFLDSVCTLSPSSNTSHYGIGATAR